MSAPIVVQARDGSLMIGEQGKLPIQSDAEYVRQVLIQARRDALGGKHGEISEEARAEAEAYLAEHDTETQTCAA